MTHNAADMAVVLCVGGVRIVERGLQDASGKIDVVHAGVVVGIDGGRADAPLSAVDGLSDLGELAVTLELNRTLGVAEGIPAHDGEFGVVAPVVGIADLIDRKSTRLNSSHLGISYAVF